MKLPVVYVYTHDSIGVGEDGPTHQPVEHLTMLRATPGINTWRPCDGVETAYAWRHALKLKDKPTALILSRQNLAPQTRNDNGLIDKGGYILIDAEDEDVVIIATGSEVQLAVDSAELLGAEGIKAKVISMPCTEIFDQQSAEYKMQVLGSKPKLAIEAGQPDFWHKYLSQDDELLGINTFGESAPLSDLLVHYGFTKENVVDICKKIAAK
jgi:transketolase